METLESGRCGSSTIASATASRSRCSGRKTTASLKVVVNDWRSDETFEVTATPDNALEIFKHPFAYRPNVTSASWQFGSSPWASCSSTSSPRAPGTTRASGSGPAGSAFNAAAAAAAAGAEATVIGTVGDDPPGRMILTELAERGVHAEVDRRRWADRDVPPRRRRGPRRPRREPRPGRAGPDRGRRVLVSGYVPAAARRARRRARGVDRARRGTARRAPAGRRTSCSRAASTTSTPSREGRRLAVVTHGAEGAIAVAGDRVERGASRRAIAADAPGSGDVFAATLLVELARGHELADALERATQAALDSLGVNLAQSLLYAAERNPGAEAIVEGDTRLTYAELLDRVARVAGGLELAGESALAAVVRCRLDTVAPLLGVPVARRDVRPALAARVGRRPRLLPRRLRRGALPRGRRGAARRRSAPRRARRRRRATRA